MPMTSAERGKKYREKQKILNLNEFRENEKARSKLNYKKLKNEPIQEDNDIIKNEIKESLSIINDNEIDENKIDDNDDNNKNQKYSIDLNILKIDESGFIYYKPLKKRINSLNKSKLQPQTIKLYITSFKKIYKNFKKEEVDDIFENELIKLLNNSKPNLNYIKEKLNFLKTDLYLLIKSLNKNDLQTIYSIFTRINGFASIIKHIYPYIYHNQLEYQQSRDNINVNSDHLHKIKYNSLSFHKDDVMKIINENTSLTKRDKLIFALFMLFPVRRPIDYIRMFLIDKEPLKEEKKLINERNNYYYNGIFYFFRTKTKEIQKFNVPNELNDLIKDYIEERKTDSLLLDNNNKQYSNSTFIIHIMKVFNNIYNISFSAIELRHYYSTYINQLVKNKEITNEEHKKICDMMNHSYEENKKYAYLLN